MRAALLEGVDDLQVADDVEIDKPHEGEILVRVQHCGVCHSDLHFVDGSLPCGYPATATDIEARMKQGFSVFVINWGDQGFKAVDIGRAAGGRSEGDNK